MGGCASFFAKVLALLSSVLLSKREGVEQKDLSII